MATLRQMVKKYGQHQTSAILQQEGISLPQPRISEMLHPKKLSKKYAAQRVREVNKDIKAHHISMQDYPRGLPEYKLTTETRGKEPPVRQFHRQHPATRADLNIEPPDLSAESRLGVNRLSVGHYPIKQKDNSLKWSHGAELIVPRGSCERLYDRAQARFGRNRRVAVTIFGTFKHNKTNYRVSPNTNYEGYKQDYYRQYLTMKQLRDALIAVQHQTDLDLQGVTRVKERREINEGRPDNYDEYPSFSARWASAFSPFRYVEVNWIEFSLIPTPKN